MPYHLGYDCKIDQPLRSSGLVSPINLTGLVNYYRMEEASGNRLDRMGVGPALVPTAATPNIAGEIGNAVDMVTSNTRMVSAAAQPALSGDFTIAAWINFPNTVTAASPFDRTAVWDNDTTTMFWSSFSFNTRFRVSNSPGASECIRADGGGGYPFNVWNLWVGTYSSTGDNKARFYFNNEAVIVGVVNTTGLSTTATPYASGIVQNLIGAPAKVDEVTIWSRVWSAAEVLIYYNGGAGINLNTYLP